MGALRYMPHKDGERFDRIEVNVVERWKESELSGDEWRFSYVVTFYLHGQKLGTLNGRSVEDCLLQAAAQFKTVKVDGELRKFIEETFCAQPGCTNPWIVLKHPVRNYDKQGKEYQDDFGESDVRGFCQKHIHRGDCGREDNDANYVTIDA